MASSLLLPAFLLQGLGALCDLAHQALEAFALFFPPGFGSHSRPPCARTERPPVSPNKVRFRCRFFGLRNDYLITGR